MSPRGYTICDEAIAVRNLSKRYGRGSPWVLRNVTLGLPQGSQTAIVGPNGVGKSTLLKCLVGFEGPTSGTVRVAGLDPVRARSRVLDNVAYVAQDTPLYDGLSVGAHISLAAALRSRFDGQAAAERLHDLRIPLRARVGDVSGGQRAQVALALALSTQAPILLLDEPTASLDPLARREFLAWSGQMARERRLTLVIASHIVGDLDGVCDRVVILAPGSVILSGDIATLLRTHRVARSIPGDATVVGPVPQPDGTVGWLLRVANGGDARLEDLVLGYLAAGRAQGERR